MDAVLPGDVHLPMYRRLKDVLLDAIMQGDWGPGDRLPSEQQLAKLYCVAPGTARQAITQLVGDGILERQQGRGTFVRQPTFASSLFRFFRFEGLSGDALYPEARILRRERELPTRVVAEQLHLSARASAISISRLRLIHQSPVLAEEIWLPYQLFKAFLGIPHADIGPLLYPAYQRVCGQVVAQAEETLTVESCDEAGAQLLNLQLGTPVIVIERLARGYDGTPLEWRRTFGRADKFRYRTDIK